ncbi:MAG: alpha/beta hydrolase [Cyclobacteriaceae bacterium]
MTELHIKFDFKARYYKLGEVNSETKQVWFVFHGYGQLAQYFIKKFAALESKKICVIAPEGLSKFYLENVASRSAGGNNRVGATWMTREDREVDIENYINYLQQVYDKEIGNAKVNVTILGFSQGAATATRWALTRKPSFERFILWAGIFPPDMNFERGKEILGKKKVIAVYGSDDPFVTAPRMQEMLELSSKLELTPEKLDFAGKHEINEPLLLQIASS